VINEFAFIRTLGTDDEQAAFYCCLSHGPQKEASYPLAAMGSLREVRAFYYHCRELELKGWEFKYGAVTRAKAPPGSNCFEAAAQLCASADWGGKWIRA
jgi:hypothetical protein